jgi:hypothetical protein
MYGSGEFEAAGIHLYPPIYVHLNRYSISFTSDYTAQLTWLSQDENMMQTLMLAKRIHHKGSMHCHSLSLHIGYVELPPSLQP